MEELRESLKAAQRSIEATAAALAVNLSGTTALEERLGAAADGRRTAADQASDAELRESIGRIGREVVRLFAATRAADASQGKTAAGGEGARDESMTGPAEGGTGWKGAWT